VAQVRFHPNTITHRNRGWSAYYLDVIKKRFNKGGPQTNRIPFSGYYMGLAYRLIYKFKVKKRTCLKTIYEFAGNNYENPEICLALCALHIAFKNYNKAIGLRSKILEIETVAKPYL